MVVEFGLDQKKTLRAKAHSLKPVVWLGQQGFTPAVLAEVELALSVHELIKVKIPGADKPARILITSQIIDQTAAVLIQVVGQIATFYRKKSSEFRDSSKTAQKKR